jgi:hypothetical protein
MPISIGGRSYPSISDLATATGLSTKTLKSYIEKGILPPPTRIDHGMREFSVFPDDYIAKAVLIVKDLARSRRQSGGASSSAAGRTQR